jgi:hypothetical protein
MLLGIVDEFYMSVCALSYLDFYFAYLFYMSVCIPSYAYLFENFYYFTVDYYFSYFSYFSYFKLI